MSSHLTGALARSIMCMALMFLLSLPSPPALAQSKDEIEEAQKILLLMGYFVRRPTGEMTPQTVEGLQKFQAQAKLPTTGRLDTATLNALRQLRDTRFSNSLSLESAQKRQQQAAAGAAAPPPKVAVAPRASVQGQRIGGSQTTITGYGQRPPLEAPSVTGGLQFRAPASLLGTGRGEGPRGGGGAGGISNSAPLSQRASALSPLAAAPREEVVVSQAFTSSNGRNMDEDSHLLRFWPWLTLPAIAGIFGWILWQAGFSRPSGPNPFMPPPLANRRPAGHVRGT